MKSTRNEKNAQLIVALLVISTFSASAEGFTGQLATVYTSYIRPALIAITVLTFIITGLFNIQEFKEGGKAAKDAFIHCLLMAIYPGAVLGLSEAVKAIMGALGTTLT